MKTKEIYWLLGIASVAISVVLVSANLDIIIWIIFYYLRSLLPLLLLYLVVYFIVGVCKLLGKIPLGDGAKLSDWTGKYIITYHVEKGDSDER
jgi:hypothetical protein